MSGGTDIATLLANMDPTLSAVEAVFCSFPNASLTDKAFLDPIGCFMEPEGLSLIISRQSAEAHGIAYSVVAAYYHDHIFVPVADAERALAVLRSLQSEAAASGGGNRLDLDQELRSVEP